MNARRTCLAVLAFASCAPPREATRRDTAAPDATEPDVVTEADTTGPEPVALRFRLAGNEPFWNLSIDATGMRFRTPEDTAGLRFGASTPVMFADSLRWNSVGDAGALEAVVVPGRCQDSMSDRTWPYRARVTIGTTRYEGCAERR